MEKIKNWWKIKFLSKPVAVLTIVSMLLFGVSLIMPASAQGLDLTTELKKAGEPAFGTGQKPLAETVGDIIQVFLGFLGTIALILVLYGGFMWMTAGGNEEKVTKAKTLLRNAVIGLIIVISAYSITYFVITQIGQATGVGVGAGTGTGQIQQ
ncbi:MAG TPA: pilin [Patescibacteria group bacterium]